jgi:hypothetical protein
MTNKPELNEDMIAAITKVSDRVGCLPQTVLRRMVFSYAAKYSDKPKEPDTTNVVSLRVDE